ncbi:RalBP1-associated Eps domain-containing protein 1 [Nymphon striatum]|nr:RalBP1-associated Eps domain-containing protein 1 [Nymphon striatum]
METLKLSEVEQQCYGKLFSCCDTENAGYVSWNKASELFLASLLPFETLSKITDLCGVKRVGQFKRSQFYIALRLISAAQNGLPIELESFHSNVDLVLPSFSKFDEKDKRLQEQQQTLFSQYVLGTSNDGMNNINTYIQQQQAQLPPGAILPPPPANRGHTRTAPVSQPRSNNIFLNDVDNTSVLRPQLVSQVIPSGNQISSPEENSAPNCMTLTPQNSINNCESDSLIEKNWSGYSKSENQPSWMQLEEHHQLLSNEDDSSDRHSSDEENDPFILTEELRKYYTEHFKSLQSDVEGVIPGAAVKQFFEQSGLPTQELSKIWQHADVDRDGALSLEEFFVAMHLVVLRRNKIELPETLPQSLQPQSLKKSAGINLMTFLSFIFLVNSPSSPSSADTASLLKEKQWTKFNDSPVSSISSPSMKPVNFDFPSVAVEQDPKILHPVPVRLSPDQMISSSDEGQDIAKLRTVSEPIPYKPLQDPSSPTSCKSPKRIIDSSHFGPDSKIAPHPSQAIQRPTPRKPSAPGPGALPPPPSSQVTSPADTDESKNPASSYSGPSSTGGPFHSGPKKEPPPPPPPRPKRNHARSSSLDLNRLGKSAVGNPPAVPPRVSPGIGTPKKLVGQHSESEVSAIEPANFAQFSDMQQNSTNKNHEDLKEINDDSLDRRRHLSAPLLSTKAKETRDKKDLSAAIKAYRKQNSIQSRLNGELNQELSEIMEERIALEIQLERLKPFSS